jgi:hypothetical protein
MRLRECKKGTLVRIKNIGSGFYGRIGTIKDINEEFKNVLVKIDDGRLLWFAPKEIIKVKEETKVVERTKKGKVVDVVKDKEVDEAIEWALKKYSFEYDKKTRILSFAKIRFEYPKIDTTYELLSDLKNFYYIRPKWLIYKLFNLASEYKGSYHNEEGPKYKEINCYFNVDNKCQNFRVQFGPDKDTVLEQYVMPLQVIEWEEWRNDPSRYEKYAHTSTFTSEKKEE